MNLENTVSNLSIANDIDTLRTQVIALSFVILNTTEITQTMLDLMLKVCTLPENAVIELNETMHRYFADKQKQVA